MEKSIVQFLRSLASCGISDLPRGDAQVQQNLEKSMAATRVFVDSLSVDGSEAPVTLPVEAEGAQGSSEGSSGRKSVEPKPGFSGDKAGRLNLLDDQVKNCFQCTELVSNRTQTVFGVGNPDARLCFMGEAPGADEDIQGEPFVGAAGQLLTRIINACKMDRQDVYILNTLKCRPPNNRNPADSECDNCRPFLDQQLEIITPEFICCLGGIAAKHLLGTDLSVGRLREKIHDYQGIKVVVTYHPAYLLRNPEAKRPVWNDMKFLMDEMGHNLS